jgi:hypothetical protein
VHEKDVIGAKRAIDEEFATPIAIGMLQPQQILLSAADGGIEAVLGGTRRSLGKYHSISLSEGGTRLQT